MFILFSIALFLILLVLVQRGKGGGLAGAFGGMGGQSAFGTKAGDLFTKVTIGVAVFWILMCVISVKLLGGSSAPLTDVSGGAEAEPGLSATIDPSPETPLPETPSSGEGETPSE